MTRDRYDDESERHPRDDSAASTDANRPQTASDAGTDPDAERVASRDDGGAGVRERARTHRRTLLAGMGGIGGLALLPNGAAAASGTQSSGGPLSNAEGAGEADPHTVATFKAFVDALLPKTPGLASKTTDANEPGGLAVGLDRFLIYSFNSYLPIEPGGPSNTGVNARLAAQLATTLDAGAMALVASGGNEHHPDLQRFPNGGPFAKLDRRDRFRAIHLLESRDRQFDSTDGGPSGSGDATGSRDATAVSTALTAVFTPGATTTSLDDVDPRLLNGPDGLSLDTLVGVVADAVASRSGTVGDLLTGVADSMRGTPLDENGFLENVSDYPGVVAYEIMGLNGFGTFGYYTEWSGYGDTKLACPNDRQFEGVANVQSFHQTGYPGPARGYADFRGYEVEEFREGAY